MANNNLIAEKADGETLNTLLAFLNETSRFPKHRSRYFWNNPWAANLLLLFARTQLPDTLSAYTEVLVYNEANIFEAMAPTGQSSTPQTGPVEKRTILHPGPDVPQNSVLADATGAKLILWVTRALFENRNTVPEKTFDNAMALCKKIVLSSQKHWFVRYHISKCPVVWSAYTDMLKVAIPVLEAQSFVTDDPAAANANGSSATLMALNHSTLMKDLERLNDLILLARNILASNSQAQNLAAENEVDQHVLKLVDVCVRVTARGYDGDAGSRSETQWANVVGSYKKLLVSALQFLYNLAQTNEKRKLQLWLDLFGNSRSGNSWFNGAISPSEIKGFFGSELASADTRILFKGVKKMFRQHGAKIVRHPAPDAEQGTTDVIKDTAQPEGATQIASTVDGLVGLIIDDGFKDQPGELDQKGGTTSATETPQTTIEPPNPPDSPRYGASTSNPTLQSDSGSVPKVEGAPDLRTPQEAALILQRAKDSLMTRLLQDQDDEDGEEQDALAGSENEDGDVPGSDVAANGSVGEGNNKYRGPGDQERGLLTDIPLVLSPSEIEALPLLIQLGTVNGEGLDSLQNSNGAQDMQSMRCNILLAQESGRNLLRELLIFIAAWDLQDDDFYFKIMMTIMEAILENGLMPFAYHALAELKDIVSPAQSMVVKILTQIFRSKQNLLPGSRAPPQPTIKPKGAGHVDVVVIRNIFINFRQGIIPETCALIYLQGQIRAGAALSEDFPLNLWDMERVYEGVYQFLEFFAVLTESEEWKNLLVEWEIVSELVTLLRELEASIPKAPLGPLPQTTAEAAAATAAAPAATQASSSQPQATPAPVAVERPYDQVPPNPTWPSTEYADGTASETPSAAIDNQDPSEFEWRNLKKLVVLVLSSLVWKSTTVQNQIRQYGGVEMVLACCNFDHNNPYIREHAIMCLRFLLEGNRENQEIVRALEPRRTVPDEVLDKRGYETYIDDKGKVGLRAKEGTGP